MKNVLFIQLMICISLWAISCSNPKHTDSDILWDQEKLPKEDNPSWTELFSQSYKLVPLETNDTCLIGQIDKIKKFKNHYYIASSGNSLFHFDEQGNFISALTQKGAGPEEFIRIEDFEVYEVNGKTEIWISDNQSIKSFDAFNGQFLYKKSFPFTIYKFKRLNNSHILLVTGQNEYILTLVDENCQVLKQYLKKEIPYLMFRPVQFPQYKDSYLFQLGLANEFVSFNPQTETFNQGHYTSNPNYLSTDELLEMFNSKGTDFIRSANQMNYLCNFYGLKDKIWIHSNVGGTNYLSKIESGKMITSTQFSYGDILATAFTGESDDSILLYILPEQQEECNRALSLKGEQLLKLDANDNPCLLEFF